MSIFLWKFLVYSYFLALKIPIFLFFGHRFVLDALYAC